ncbi:hypothetical protein SEA_WEASELS2_160 [Rhodococcus phage Weasels2]|uniref:Uncharacterized protein n=1 Tax=Rhodococcus phage Weasels2 TaxID=1897437 RepID=A0A1I9SAD4_9CAUD|nr:hypothetical protein FDH04_gp254 [Rhodococcus phage Weasels2]AOZ63740.1 hypothetical protein SEA_WEASELS2_160 [Rhodococcus phage Weasels2]
MAKGTLKVEEVEKVVKVDEKSVVLEFSLEEAQALYDVFCRIGGHPRASRRGHIKSIQEALKSVVHLELGHPRVGVMYNEADIAGHLSFRDTIQIDEDSDW